MEFSVLGNYVNGSFYLPVTSGFRGADNLIEKFSPADLSKPLWTIPEEYNATECAVESAATAFRQWKGLAVEEKVKLLNNYLIALRDSVANLAYAMALELGTPQWIIEKEVLDTCEYISQLIVRGVLVLKGHSSETASTQYRPHGPVLLITPFCNSLQIFHEQLVSALLSGNTVIVKPSEKIAYSFQIMFEALHRSGFPNGVVNLIQGTRESANRMLKDKRIAAIYFTGSLEAGKHVLSATADNLTKFVSLGMSSKNTTIIHKDTDFNLTLNHLLYSSLVHSGQLCTKTSIVAIHSTIRDDFMERFHQLAKNISIDHPLSENRPFMGTMIDQAAVDKYLLFVGMAKREGMDEIMRGKQLDKKLPGYYVTPSINFCKQINDKSLFLTSELLAPNITFVSYDEIEEAIHISNQLNLGLVASLYTTDDALIAHASQNLIAGQININLPTTNYGRHLPSVGLKQSGNHTIRGIGTIDGLTYSVTTCGSARQNGTGYFSF